VSGGQHERLEACAAHVERAVSEEMSEEREGPGSTEYTCVRARGESTIVIIFDINLNDEILFFLRKTLTTLEPRLM
jgi:hypothetical protein